jgi:hypothetical protein
MVRIECDKPLPFSHLEILKIKSRRDRASHHRKRLPIRHMGREPAPRPDHRLQDLPRGGIATEKNPRMLPLRINHMYEQRFAGIEVPNLVGPQPVKRGEVFSFQQKIDCRRSGPRSGKSRRQGRARDYDLRPVGLAKIPALRMRLKLQLLDPVPSIPDRQGFLPNDSNTAQGSRRSTTKNLTLMLFSCLYLAGPARRLLHGQQRHGK